MQNHSTYPQPDTQTIEQPVAAGHVPESEEVRQHAERAAEPELKVVLWEHSWENGKATAEQVADCDVLAFEFTGFENAELRRVYDQAATTFISSTASQEERDEAKEYITRHGDKFGACFSVLDKLQGTDKQVITLDFNKDDPQQQMHKELNHEEELYKAARFEYPLSKDIEAQTLKVARAEAKLHNSREDMVAAQIEGILTDERMQGKKIGVLIGAGHTRVTHLLSKKHDLERVFVQDKGVHRGNKMQYRAAGTLWRHLNLVSETQVPDSLVRRVVLEHLYDTHSIERKIGKPGGSPSAETNELMSDDQVSELLLAVDSIKRNMGRVPVVSRWRMGRKVTKTLLKNQSEVAQKAYDEWRVRQDSPLTDFDDRDQAA